MTSSKHYIRPLLVHALLLEVKRGVEKYGDFESLSQFEVVLLREVIELSQELKANKVDLTKVWRESLQVAAVAIRGIEEIERRTLG